ncbi:MAG: hypothetical protein ACXAEN_23950 [Candidatus Thorarchaeota archaeon]
MAVVKGKNTVLVFNGDVLEWSTTPTWGGPWWPDILGGKKDKDDLDAQQELDFDLLDELGEDVANPFSVDDPTDQVQHTCNCDFDTLWKSGCQCGGI